MNGYELSRYWFDWCFLNPEKIKPSHSALYFFCIEHCNRLGWKEKFGLPTTMTMEALGIKSYNTYRDTLVDLVDWGFIKMIEKSKNQYSSNIIALSNFNKAIDKALDKALIKHTSKQSESTEQSIDSIDKQLTINNEQLNLKQIDVLNFFGFEATPKNISHQRLINDFVNVKILSNEIEYFFEQFYDYAKYILNANKQAYKFSLAVFLGDQKKEFADGKWNNENWELKLKDFEASNKSKSQAKFDKLKDCYNIPNPYEQK